MYNLIPILKLLFPFSSGFSFGGGDDDGGGEGQDPAEFARSFGILGPGQQSQIVQDLLRFRDFPDQPLGTRGREVLGERLAPEFIPYAFRPDVLNPFVQAQFRLGREQLGQDVERQRELFQRQGAFFTPDLQRAEGRLSERQNLNEQDFLKNLLFQGGLLRENLATDALGRAFGLEQNTAGVLSDLLEKNLTGVGIGAGMIPSLSEMGYFDQSGGSQIDPMTAIMGGLGGLSSFFGERRREGQQGDFLRDIAGREGYTVGDRSFLTPSARALQNQDQTEFYKDPRFYTEIAKLVAMLFAGGCWVASVIYGKTIEDGWFKPETIKARLYVNLKAPNWFRNFYYRNGRNIAKFIHKHSWLKPIVRPLFDWFGRKAVHSYAS